MYIAAMNTRGEKLKKSIWPGICTRKTGGRKKCPNHLGNSQMPHGTWLLNMCRWVTYGNSFFTVPCREMDLLMTIKLVEQGRKLMQIIIGNSLTDWFKVWEIDPNLDGSGKWGPASQWWKTIQPGLSRKSMLTSRNSRFLDAFDDYVPKFDFGETYCSWYLWMMIKPEYSAHPIDQATYDRTIKNILKIIPSNLSIHLCHLFQRKVWHLSHRSDPVEESLIWLLAKEKGFDY